MPAVAPYVAATTAAADGAAARPRTWAATASRLARRTARCRSRVTRGDETRELRSRRFHRADGPDRARPDPDRHARDGLDPRGRPLGGPGAARPARRPGRAARHPRRGGAGGPARRAPRRRGHRRRLRPARAARRPVRHRRGRAPAARRRRALADRHLRRAGLLRHRPHQRVAPRPDDPRPRALGRPLLPPARPAGRLRRPRHPPRPRRPTGGWWRPARGATSRPRRRAPVVVRRRGCG